MGPDHKLPSTDRRTFLKSASAAALTSTAMPNILQATDKSGSKRPVLGEGEYTYELIHGWEQLPSHIRWGQTHGVAIDAQGFIYIKHLSEEKDPMDAIAVFDADGRFVRSFGKEYHGGGHGIDIRTEAGEQFLYLSDIGNRQVVKTNLKGEHVWKLSYPQEPGVYQKLEQYRPTNVAFAPDGGFYVADGYGSHFIHQYDKNAKWVRTFSGPGTEPGKCQTPHGIWLDDRAGREPAIIVADRANARLQYFTLDGKFKSIVGDVSFPAHFDIRGEHLMVPDLHARISIFDKDDKVIVHLGNDPAWTKQVLANRMKLRTDQKLWRADRFIHPHDACFDPAGNIYVAEWVPMGRIIKMRRVS